MLSLIVMRGHLYRQLTHRLDFGQIISQFLQDFVKFVTPPASHCGQRIFASHNPFTLSHNLRLFGGDKTRNHKHFHSPEHFPTFASSR